MELVTSQIVKIESKDFLQMQKFVAAAFELRNSPIYQKHLAAIATLDVQKISQPHYSVLMGYDFHLTPQGPKLIEINTNAAFSLFATQMRRMHQLSEAQGPGAQFEDELFQTFLNEWKLFAGNRKLTSIAIMDENHLQQKLLPEFYLFEKLFLRKGIANVVLGSPEDFSYDESGKKLLFKNKLPIDLVYNRNTDFYFQQPSMLPFQKAFLAKTCCITPHPREYFLLGDKERFLQFSDKSILSKCLQNSALIEDFSNCIEPAMVVSATNREDLWQMRKSLFFKPLRSYGGKATYKGESVSRKAFDEIICAGDFLAQKYIPAPQLELADANGKVSSWKYDVRCYVYKNQIQLLTSRIFQGQVTNFRTPGSGFASVVVKS